MSCVLRNREDRSCVLVYNPSADLWYLLGWLWLAAGEQGEVGTGEEKRLCWWDMGMLRRF